jgi:hypothetical protein
MKQKVTASFAIVLALAMILSTNPAMIMPSSIFASSDGDESGSQDESDSSESEQPEEESEPEQEEESNDDAPEETEPETTAEDETLRNMMGPTMSGNPPTAVPPTNPIDEAMKAAANACEPPEILYNGVCTHPDNIPAQLPEPGYLTEGQRPPECQPQNTITQLDNENDVNVEPNINCANTGFAGDTDDPLVKDDPNQDVCTALGCPGNPPDPTNGCNDGRDPVNGVCPPPDPNPTSTPSNGGSGSTLSTTIINPAAPTTTNVDPEVSNCRLDGNANGIQQQFDTARYSACGLHPTGQTAYTEGFTAGCTQAGNTPQMCTAFIQLNTGAPSTQTQPPTTTQPTQAIPPTD